MAEPPHVHHKVSTTKAFQFVDVYSLGFSLIRSWAEKILDCCVQWRMAVGGLGCCKGDSQKTKVRKDLPDLQSIGKHTVINQFSAACCQTKKTQITKFLFQINKRYLVSCQSSSKQGEKAFNLWVPESRRETCLLLHCLADVQKALPPPKTGFPAYLALFHFFCVPFWTQVPLTLSSNAYLLHFDHRLPLLRKSSHITIKWLYLQCQIHLAQQMSVLKSFPTHPLPNITTSCLCLKNESRITLVEFNA